jgi:hypothetical protein
VKICVVPRPLNKGLGPRQIKLWFSLHDIILVGKSIGLEPKKKSLKESSWFGEPKCKLGSKVVHFFYPSFSNFVRMKDMLSGLRTLLRAHYLSHFWPILKFKWLVLWILAKWLLERMHFQPIQVHEMKVKNKNKNNYEKNEKNTKINQRLI